MLITEIQTFYDNRHDLVGPRAAMVAKKNSAMAAAAVTSLDPSHGHTSLRAR